MNTRTLIVLVSLLGACSGPQTTADAPFVSESVVVADYPAVPVGDGVVDGKNDALVTMHSYVDPASPAFNAVLVEFSRMSAEYEGELRLVVKAPAELSPAGRDALIAMHAAGQQGKRKPMFALLVKWRQVWLTGGALALAVSRGEEIGLDLEVFRRSLEQTAIREVDEQVAWAEERGLSGALAFNGRRYFDMIEPVPLDAATKLTLDQARSMIAAGTTRPELYATAAEHNATLAPFGRPFRDSELIPVGKSPSFGNRAGKVKVVAFMDFQCPFSRRAAVTMAQLVSENREVELVFKHLPLSFHKQAREAAAVSVAAAAQGRFWEMSEQLFLNQTRLSKENMDELVAELGNGLDLDVVRLMNDRDAAYAVVDADMALAGKLMVKATPNFFINGKRFTGAQPLEEFRVIVAEQLALAGTLEVNPMDIYAESVRQSYAEPAPTPARTPETPSFSVVPVEQGDPVRGAKKDFMVTVVEFSDYQCPFCRRAEKTLDEVLDKHGDNVRIVFKHRPLPFHKSAALASMAAVAAGKQGKYWEMHEALFAERLPGVDEMDTYTEGLAKKLGLQMKKFKRDRTAAKDKVEKDNAFAEEIGARGTPTFYINGQKLVGAQPYHKFKAMIEEELAFAEKVKEETKLSGGELYDEVMKRHTAE